MQNVPHGAAGGGQEPAAGHHTTGREEDSLRATPGSPWAAHSAGASASYTLSPAAVAQYVPTSEMASVPPGPKVTHSGRKDN